MLQILYGLQNGAIRELQVGACFKNFKTGAIEILTWARDYKSGQELQIGAEKRCIERPFGGMDGTFVARTFLLYSFLVSR